MRHDAAASAVLNGDGDGAVDGDDDGDSAAAQRLRELEHKYDYDDEVLRVEEEEVEDEVEEWEDRYLRLDSQQADASVDLTAEPQQPSAFALASDAVAPARREIIVVDDSSQQMQQDALHSADLVASPPRQPSPASSLPAASERDVSCIALGETEAMREAELLSAAREAHAADSLPAELSSDTSPSLHRAKRRRIIVESQPSPPLSPPCSPPPPLRLPPVVSPVHALSASRSPFQADDSASSSPLSRWPTALLGRLSAVLRDVEAQSRSPAVPPLCSPVAAAQYWTPPPPPALHDWWPSLPSLSSCSAAAFPRHLRSARVFPAEARLRPLLPDIALSSARPPVEPQHLVCLFDKPYAVCDIPRALPELFELLQLTLGRLQAGCRVGEVQLQTAERWSQAVHDFLSFLTAYCYDVLALLSALHRSVLLHVLETEVMALAQWLLTAGCGSLARTAASASALTLPADITAAAVLLLLCVTGCLCTSLA